MPAKNDAYFRHLKPGEKDHRLPAFNRKSFGIRHKVSMYLARQFYGYFNRLVVLE
jgi:hypothetical protein